ncbi:MAG: TonB-dependent receptor, partial [Hyphomicrobium sp.]|nr:TonB-dependent receptor [Hyphomicrobium sp.]
SNHTKVLIDGIDVSDPSNPNRSFDFGQMLTTDIDRIEVLRGPQSGLYGADALGGVIVIYTKAGKGPPKATGMVEGGSFGTFNQAASISGGTDRYNYSFNVSHFRADDTPVTPFDLLPPGTIAHGNRYDNWTYSTKIGVDVTKDVAVNFVARYTDATLYFTGNPGDNLSRSDFDQFYTRGEVVWTTLGGNLTNYFGVNYANLQTDNTSASYGNSSNDGERVKYDWRSVLRVAPGYTIVTGAEHQNEQLDTPALFAEEWNRAGFAELQSEIFRNFFLVANVRYDDNENFGGHTTWRVAPAYVIDATGTKLKGSVGTAFKAPTLSQRFQDFPPYFFGNPDLAPEESLGMDAGFEQAVLGGRAQFGATYFYNDITNLIDSNATYTSYANVGRAKTSGVEVFASADITESLRVRADYTYTEATNEITHTELLRRPRNKASLSAGWTPYDPLLLTASLVYIGETADIDRATYANVTQPGFTLVNVAADYKLKDGVFVSRIENWGEGPLYALSPRVVSVLGYGRILETSHDLENAHQRQRGDRALDCLDRRSEHRWQLGLRMCRAACSGCRARWRKNEKRRRPDADHCGLALEPDRWLRDSQLSDYRGFLCLGRSHWRRERCCVLWRAGGHRIRGSIGSCSGWRVSSGVRCI